MSNIGSSKIAEMYLGSTKIAQAYLGSTKVYESTQPGPPVPADGVLIGNQIWSKFYVNMDFCGVAPKNTRTYHGLVISYYERSQLSSLTFPDNWRLPNRTDISILKKYVGERRGEKLVSVEDGGTDEYGLNLYKTGYLTGSYYSTFKQGSWATFSRYGDYIAYAGSGSSYDNPITEYYDTTRKKATPFRLILDV